MKAFVICSMALVLALPLKAQKAEKPCASVYQYVESKNYYFTSLLQTRNDVDSLIATNTVLNDMAREKQEKLRQAHNPEEYVAAFKFTNEEIQKAGKALATLYKEGNALERLMTQAVLPSGCYQQYKETGSELIRKIWEQDAQGMNYAIDVYAAARKPNYPNIDSIGFDIRSLEFRQELLPSCKENVEKWNEAHPTFYSIPLKAVSLLLDLNDRLQAADFEPMAETVNQSSYAQVGVTRWQDYPYSAILVLGAGPEDPRVSISPSGKMRTAYAALLYRDGLAPFIIVSGGRVHPYHTPYSEAYEMKKYLMEMWQIPEKAIIMEPHARHTTTNFRNAARIMLALGFPKDKYAIVSSSKSHIDYVEAPEALLERCKRELGYEPYKIGKRLSDRIIEFMPLPLSQIINPLEPIDP
ncbi:MAG: YdcF family protein [Bacteroides sp.]|nr:YdcF family protein [Bacteroides sp.]